MTDAIYRRIENGETPLVAAYKGSKQITFAIIATTLILVEPVPYLFNQLKKNYEKRNINNITFINKAVSNYIGYIELTVPSQTNDFSKLPIWASQLASTNENHCKML